MHPEDARRAVRKRERDAKGIRSECPPLSTWAQLHHHLLVCPTCIPQTFVIKRDRLSGVGYFYNCRAPRSRTAARSPELLKNHQPHGIPTVGQASRSSHTARVHSSNQAEFGRRMFYCAVKVGVGLHLTPITRTLQAAKFFCSSHRFIERKLIVGPSYQGDHSCNLRLYGLKLDFLISSRSGSIQLDSTRVGVILNTQHVELKSP